MKEDSEKSFSVLKSRIRHFAKVRKISMREIYDKSGISVGTFSNSSSLSEEALFKMLSCFEELDANWLITGKGDMTRNISDSKDIGYDFDCWDFDDDHLFFTGK